MKKTSALEQQLNYKFINSRLLQQALTHRSHSASHNERLEFLGDAVLNFVVASMLYERFQKLDEGDLSRLRANLVKQAALADLANSLNLSDYLRLGEGELKSGGYRRPSILSDTFEAILGAIYIDGGYGAAAAVINMLYEPIVSEIDTVSLGKDPKTLLQELLQAHKLNLPEYEVISTTGAAHDQLFEVQCTIAQLNVKTTASGGNRRAAEQEAASNALSSLADLNIVTGGGASSARAVKTLVKADKHQDNQ